MDLLTGVQLKRRSGVLTPAVDALQSVDVVAFYFGQRSCYSCRVFTTYLTEVYRDLKRRKESFEVVFVSTDHSASDSDAFVRESHANWLSVPFEDPLIERICTHFSVVRLPCVILVKSNGDVITSAGVYDVIKVGADSFACWREGKGSFKITDELPTDDKRLFRGCCDLPWGNSETSRSGYLSAPPDTSATCLAPIQLLAGKTLERKSGAEVTTEEALSDVAVVAMCFWADWCSSCRDFLPCLSECYRQLKGGDGGGATPFEVIFVKSDYCAGPKELFMRDDIPDWLVVPLAKDPLEERSLIRQVLDKFGIFRIPSLLVMKPDGKLITTEGFRDVRVKGTAAFSDWLEGRGSTEEDDEDDGSENSSSCNGCCYFPWAASYHRKTSFTRLIAVCPPQPFRPPPRTWVPEAPVDVLSGKRLVRNGESGLQEVTIDEVEKAEVVAFYFAAHWCPPCRKFSPILAEVYRQLQVEHLPIEVVFISWDESEDVMKGHMKESHAEWLAVAYENQGNGDFNLKFNVDTIPHLCIVSKTGAMITKNGRRDIMLKKSSAVTFWLQGLPATSDSDEYDDTSEWVDDNPAEQNLEG